MKTVPLLHWLNLVSGSACLAWTILLHGQLYGFQQLPHAGTTIMMVGTNLLLMIFVFIIHMGSLAKKGLAYKLTSTLDRYRDLQMAILLPVLFFGLVFLFSPHSLKPFETFIRRIGMPLLVYVLLLLSVWIIRAGSYILQTRTQTTSRKALSLVINRSQLHRNLWMLFIFLLVSNFLASIIFSVSISRSMSELISSRFLVENEASIYTYASAICLLLISIGFLGLGYFSSKWSLRAIWLFLGMLFLVFSVDEVTSMHEGLIAAIRLAGQEMTSSVFVYLLPVSLLILGVIFLAVRTLRDNHIQHWGLFLVGFVMLIGGAVFVESFTESLEMIYGEGLMPLLLVKSLLFLEEGLELSGSYLIFFFAMDQFFDKNREIKITIGEPSDP